MWKFIIKNKKWLFSGAGVALVGGIIGIVFGLRKPTPITTDDHSPVQQMTPADAGNPTQQMTRGDFSPTIRTGDHSPVTYSPRVGLSKEEVNETVRAALEEHGSDAARLRQDNTLLADENEQLKAQLVTAIRRADQAEKQGSPDAAGLIEALRETGDTAGLLKFLLAERSRLQADKIEINREISAVAYLRGEIDTARSALEEILQASPDDLQALNRTTTYTASAASSARPSRLTGASWS